MKSLLKNVGVLFALLLTLTFQASADSNRSTPQLKNIDSKFILKGKEILDPRAIEKIDIMGDELFVKTGVNVYIYASNRYADKTFSDTKSKIEFIKSFETTLTKDLKDPYVLLTVSLQDKHVNMYSSDELKAVVDKDTILSGYIVPLLASYDKNSQEAKLSAGLLNGYSAVVESVAQAKGIKIDSIINGGGRTFAMIWKIVMYLLVIVGITAYFYALWKEKRFK
jgi:hypothetical protein